METMPRHEQVAECVLSMADRAFKKPCFVVRHRGMDVVLVMGATRAEADGRRRIFAERGCSTNMLTVDGTSHLCITIPNELSQNT